MNGTRSELPDENGKGGIEIPPFSYRLMYRQMRRNLFGQVAACGDDLGHREILRIEGLDIDYPEDFTMISAIVKSSG